MPGFRDTVLDCGQSPRGAQMQCSDPRQAGHRTRARDIMSLGDGRSGRQDESMVSGSGQYAPMPGAFEEDGVDAVFGAADEPVGH